MTAVFKLLSPGGEDLLAFVLELYPCRVSKSV